MLVADRNASLAMPAAHLVVDPDEDVDALLVDVVRSAVPWLDAEMVRLLRRPGKRLRPALVLYAARCGRDPDLAAARRCAAAVELLHRGSLVHDDLMDDAPFRGEQATVHQRVGAAGAVLGGDYLIAVAGRLVAEVAGSAARVWQDAYVDMCLGQARETANRYRLVSPVEYLATIRGKTAAPLRAATHLGGLCAGLAEPWVCALAEFGDRLGVLLQLVDDVLDVVSTAALCGKPVQHDVGQGIYTLPVLFAAGVRDGRAPRWPRSGPLALAADLPPARLAAIYDHVREHGLRRAVAVAADWADRAAAALTGLPPSPARDRLAGLPGRYLRDQLATKVAPGYRHLVELG